MRQLERAITVERTFKKDEKRLRAMPIHDKV